MAANVALSAVAVSLLVGVEKRRRTAERVRARVEALVRDFEGRRKEFEDEQRKRDEWLQKQLATAEVIRSLAEKN
ncbi:MAG TPA: hypothetical protein VK116_06675 [Planctomycetota bacterium]|nr:hypothetical protein [Planctomycetota bacterium]